MPDVSMPRLSDSMEEGTILKWLKSDGDEVAKGDELVEIETDKANMTYEADADGVLSIVADEGDTLAVGETIARLGEAGEDGGGEAGDEDEEEPEAKADDDEDDADEPEADADDDAKEKDEDEPESDADDDAKDEDEPESDAEDDDDEAAADSNGKPEKEPEPAPAAEEKESGGGENGDGRVKASPVARRMARELGLELAALEGTGPGGRIVKADVEAASEGDGEAEPEAPAEDEQQQPAAADGGEDAEDVPAPVLPSGGDGEAGRGEASQQDLSKLQQTVARRMAESKATAPEFVITAEVDMEEAVDLRRRLKAAAGEDPAPSFNDFVIKASALALREFPRANAAYRDGKFELYGRVNVGVAVAGQDALVVPTIFDADRKGLGTIASESRTVAERVRAGAVTPPELSSGTFTVSNLGMFGIKRFVAVINPPQAAILAVGTLEPRAVVRDGEVVVRNTMELTLSCDHRILYGADAAAFLARIRERLENPLSLAL